MNVEGVAFHATALQQVANDLQKSINQVREPTVGSESVWTKWVMGYVSSTLILRALATEQMLKVLSYMRTGNYGPLLGGHSSLIGGRGTGEDARWASAGRAQGGN